MTFKVSITKQGEAEPFWTKVVATAADALRVVQRNQRLIDRQQWKHVITVEEVP